MKQLFVVCSLIIVPLLTRVKCVPILTLTTSPFSMGTFCQRPVNITCTGSEISFTFLWKNGLIDIASYGYRLSHEGSFPRPISLEVPLQGVTAEVTTARLLSSLTVIDIVSTLFIEDVSVLDGYSVSCEDGVGIRSVEVNITVTSQDTPPSPSGASCSVLSSTGGPSVVLELDPSFIMNYAVESYTVTVDPATSSCSNDQLSPNNRYSCTGLTVGTSYTFSISAVNCVDQIGATHTITVHPQNPSITSSTIVMSTYTSSAESAELNEVLVQWEHVDQPAISEGCSFNDELNYTVVLEDNGTIIEQRVISSDSCVNGFCETSFVSTSSNSYVVHVTATNGIGISSGTIQSSTIERSIPFIFDVSFANCETSVLCSYNSMGNCTVQFTQNPDYQDLSEGTLGRLNTPFLLPLMEPTTTFYYQATVTINSSTTIQIRRSFTTEEFDVRLTSANLALLVLGVILFCVAISSCVVLVVVTVISDKGSRLSLVMLVVEGVVIVVPVVLWIAVGFQVGLQDNTCDFSWQETRDNLIIVAFVFSLSALLILASATIVLVLYRKPRSKNRYDAHKKEGWEIQLHEGRHEIKRDIRAGRVKNLETPEILANEFKVTGEKPDKAIARVGERIFQEYDSKVDEVVALQKNTSPVKVAATPENIECSTEQDKKDSNDKGNKKCTSGAGNNGNQFPPCVTMCKYNILLAGNKTQSPEEAGEQVAAWFPEKRKWSVEDLGTDEKLKVYFDDKFDNKSEVNSKEAIMGLLEVSWKGCFIAHPNKKDCNIHVTLQGSSDGSWSALGCEAKHFTKKKEPSMVLNFRTKNEDEVKTTVLHQFGHALGLGHTLMKPEDWVVLKPHLKIDEMMSSYGSPNMETFEVQWTGKNINKKFVNYDSESIMHCRTNPEWIKGEKLPSGAQKQISKHSTPQDQLSKNDLKVLASGVIRPAFTLKDLESLENEASKETFHLTAKLAPSWRIIGENIGFAAEMLDQISASKSTDEAGKLTAVWSKWLSHTEEFPNYPRTRKGLRQLLLESCDKETAEQFFDFLG